MDSDYKCSLAYLKKKSEEISTVDVELKVRNKKIMILVRPEDDYYAIDELVDILKEFQKSHLSRINVDLFNECEVYLDNSDALRKIVFKDSTFEISKIEEVERD